MRKQQSKIDFELEEDWEKLKATRKLQDELKKDAEQLARGSKQ